MGEDYGYDLMEYLAAFGRFPFEPGPVDDEGFVTVGSRAAALAAVEDAFDGPPPHALVLLGDDGIGRSALLRAAGARLAGKGMRIFEASSSDVLAGQRFIGEVEERLAAVAAAGRDSPLVWLLPDLAGAAGAGAYHEDPRGMLERLSRYLERGDVRLLGQADTAAWTAVVQRRPALASAIRAVRVDPLTADESLVVARAWLADRQAAMSEETLAETLELADQFLPEVAYPGRLLRVVIGAHEAAGREGGHAGDIAGSHVLAALNAATGLPLLLLDHRERLDVERVREFFQERILGQPDAVEALVQRITMFKAGLTDPTRPLGVFLFVGPTGSGKTELAKTLAQYLFGSPSRLVRLDMSEYQTPDSLERLLAGPDSPEAADMVRAIRRQPFSVLLLDEFEKAHPAIWDVFLQVFDDGRLTDRSGQTADFRHAVVILTANLGAARHLASGIGFGEGAQTFSPAALEREVMRAFRPEFVNRLDRVVVFRPFSREVMRSIVRKELGEVVRRRGLRSRPWAIEWDESAVDLLLERGFTPDLGARPLKRAIEEHLLVPLARTIVEHQAPEGEQFLFVRARDGREIDVQFVDPSAEIVPPAPAGAVRAGDPTLAAVAAQPAGTVAEAAFLEAELNALGEEIEGDEWRARKDAGLARIAEPAFWDAQNRHGLLAEIETRDRIEAGFRTARSLLARLARSREGDRVSRPLARLLALRLHLLRVAVSALEAGEPGDAFVAVEADLEDAEARSFAARLIRMYRLWGEERGMHLEELDLGRGDRDVGALSVSGFGAWAILRDENGLHVLESPGAGTTRAVVRVTTASRPLEPIERTPAALRSAAAAALAGAVRDSTVVRRYREHPSPLVRDAVREWRTGRFDQVLAGDFDVIAG